MSEFDIIRAWKDPDYRESLTEEQRSQLPENPAGMVELPDDEMEQIQGGGLGSKCWGRTKKCFLGFLDPSLDVEVDKGGGKLVIGII